jgi:hypothetical protein
MSSAVYHIPEICEKHYFSKLNTDVIKRLMFQTGKRNVCAVVSFKTVKHKTYYL